MDKDVEAFVRICYPCQLVGARPSPEQIRSTSLLHGPWDEIAIYLCGPLPSGEGMLVVIDYADGRKCRKMLPKLHRREPMNELQWHVEISERDERRNMYEKEYDDNKRSAKVSDIEVGEG